MNRDPGDETRSPLQQISDDQDALLPWRVDSKATNPKDAAATTRIDLSLFPPVAIAWGALAMTEGDLKYGGFNYRVAGVQASVYIGAAMRHLGKYLNGEDADPETKVPHLASVLACAGILADAIAQGNLNDDRPPPQSNAFYRELEANVAHLQTIFPRRQPRHRASDTKIGKTALTGVFNCPKGPDLSPTCRLCKLVGSGKPHHPLGDPPQEVAVDSCGSCSSLIQRSSASPFWRAI